MTTDTAGHARARARELVERALITDKGRGGIAASFDALEERLRRYAPALTEHDRDDVRAYINARVDAVYELLNLGPAPDQIWTAALDDYDDDLADAGDDPAGSLP